MSKPLVSNASNEKQVRNAGQKVKFNRLQELQDVTEILKTAPGQRFLWKYLDSCGVFRTSYDSSGSKINFNEGVRSVGLMLLADITEASPEIFTQMMLAHRQQETEE